MQRSLIILDDVLDNAEEIRAAALRLDYPEAARATYPGRNSRQAANIAGLVEACAQVVGERLVPATDGYGKFRITLEGDEARDGYAGVHVDECHWSGIYYLSRPQDCRGGTDFFRHLPTGLEHAPHKPEHLRQAGVASYREFVERHSGPDATDPSKWELLMRVPMKFNRLVLFRPWLWHTATPGFGDSLESGRLIHLLFFNSAGPLAAPEPRRDAFAFTL